MENNENNVQEQVKKVKKDVPKGNAAKGFVVAALLIVFLGIGFGFGFLCSKGWNPFAIKTSSKKIDESKPWVYDAEYCLNNEEKIAYGLYEGEEFKSKEYLKVPYININSDYAKKTNEEIKAMYDKLYNSFGEKSGELAKVGELSYEFYNTDKVLSVSIMRREGVTNAGWSKEYIVYNINLDTLKEASFEDVYKACGFESETELKESAKIALDNLIIENPGAYDGTVLKYDKYFINKNGVNLFIPSPAGGQRTLEVKKGVEKINKISKKIENGTYKRISDGEASGSTLEIKNSTDDSFDFTIDAYRYTRPEDIQWCIDNGAVNIGELSGTAKRIDTDKFEFEEADKDLLDLCGGVYKTQFTIKSDNTISIVTIMASEESDPHCGHGVTLAGKYSK